MDAISTFIEQSGNWTYVLAPLFMIVVAILPIPAEIPAMMNGMIFGAQVGTAITWGGGLMGAMISFELARRLGRPLAEKIISPGVLAKTDTTAVCAGWPGLLLLRLMPVVAFTAINWVAGLTPLSRWTFFWTTALGVLPGAILFTVTGVGVAAFYQRHPELTPLLIVALIVVVAWTVWRVRGMRREEG
jgi:uncharacterized membrane protein YdjX (TVP38/TMEM64 family)